MRIRILFIMLLAGAAATSLLACPSCPYDARCEGNVLHTCWLGVDQLVGDPARTADECLAPNPVCINLSESNALCATDGEATCDESFEPYCGEGIAVHCSDGYEVATDCAINGNTCHEIGDSVRCALSPLTACSLDVYVTHCDGSRVITCEAGYVVARDCREQEPIMACVEYTNEYGHSAYCD